MAGSRAPKGLGAAGRRLWRTLTADYEFEPHEVALLAKACRAADRVDRLEVELRDAPLTVPGSRGQPIANPLGRELRDEIATLSRLLDGLNIPGDQRGQWNGLSASQRARKAAHARWSGGKATA